MTPADATASSTPREVRVCHTAALSVRELRAIEDLLYGVFDEMDDDALDHALGGLHACVFEGEELVAHGSVVLRRLIYRGRVVRTGYLEAVAVRADRRGRGHGAAVMDRLEEILRSSAYELGALGASEQGSTFYARRGWRRWVGASWALTPAGIVRTTEHDGDIFVLETALPLDERLDLVCDWRAGDLW